MKKYEDIINMPHHQSEFRPHMSQLDRGAQFAPFAALTGLDDDMKETARQTIQKIEPDENQQEILDYTFSKLKAIINNRPFVRVTHFVPDILKSGGSYKTIDLRLKKIDNIKRVLIFVDGTEISVDNILDISYSEKVDFNEYEQD